MNQREEIESRRRILEKSSEIPMPKRRDYRIGIIGSGFIVEACHLPAYQKAGFSVAAIASRTREHSEAVAAKFKIAKVYDDWKTLIDDTEIEILDFAFPPHLQPELVRYACQKSHIKGILCQKPSAVTLAKAAEIQRLGRESGVWIAVNSNMRCDPAMRALRHTLEQGWMGKPVLANIVQHAVPHWQKFAREYERLAFLNFSIHELDIFRYLFGEPTQVTALCRTDPRQNFLHKDGIVQYTYQYADGLMATSLDDTFAWPGEPCEEDTSITWRVAGEQGLAKGSIGWTKFPELVPSTFELTAADCPGGWIRPQWDTCWFPDAFGGTMASLLKAVEQGKEPEHSAADHVKTLACVEACYRSVREQRTVALEEILAAHHIER